jgi:hypothetical protein
MGRQQGDCSENFEIIFFPKLSAVILFVRFQHHLGQRRFAAAAAGTSQQLPQLSG